MLTSKRELLADVKFRVGEYPLGRYARIEVDEGGIAQPICDFHACDGKAHEIATRIVELLNLFGVAEREQKLVRWPMIPPDETG